MIYQISKLQNYKSYDKFLTDCENYLIDFFEIDKESPYLKKPTNLFIISSKIEYQEMIQTNKSYAVAHANFYEKSICAVSQENIRDEYDVCRYKKMLFHELTHIYSTFFMTSDFACSNQYLIPWWLREGISVCISGDIADAVYCRDIHTLFHQDITSNVAYTGGGFFVKHILTKYGKEKFLNFLSLFRGIKSKEDVNNFFAKIYEKNLEDELKIMCKESVQNIDDYTDENFQKKIEEKIKNFKLLCEKFFKINFICPSINILFSRDELSKKYEKIFNKNFSSEYNFFVDDESNVLNILKIDPFSTYIIEDLYYGYLCSKVFKIFLNQLYSKNIVNFLPNFLLQGLGGYLSNYLEFNDMPEDIDFMFNIEEKNLFFLQKAGISFIKHLVKAYSKETFLEFLKSLREIKSKEEAYIQFKKIYKKDAKEILKEIGK